jgi:hypothetical protein
MKSNLLKGVALAMLLSAAPMAYAQFEGRPGQGETQTARIYGQVNDVRNALGLDSKQFDKVYKAYKKYTEAVENSNSGFQRRPMGGMMGGGPGMGGGMMGGGPGMGGGMMGGGPGMGGDMMGGGPGMGGEMPSEGMSERADGDDSKRPSAEEMEKRKQNIEKQETKLRKSMKKILKDEATYDQWVTIREKQIAPPQRKGRRHGAPNGAPGVPPEGAPNGNPTDAPEGAPGAAPDSLD